MRGTRGWRGRVCRHGRGGRLRHHCESRAAWRVLCRCGVVALQVRPSARFIGCPGLRGARCRESAVSHDGRAGASQGCQRVQNTQLTCTYNFLTRFSPSQPEASPSWPMNGKQRKNPRVFNEFVFPFLPVLSSLRQPRRLATPSWRHLRRTPWPRHGRWLPYLEAKLP